jgi:hypothetical protein
VASTRLRTKDVIGDGAGLVLARRRIADRSSGDHLLLEPG